MGDYEIEGLLKLMNVTKKFGKGLLSIICNTNTCHKKKINLVLFRALDSGSYSFTEWLMIKVDNSEKKRERNEFHHPV